jgi:hypothetical protein
LLIGFFGRLRYVVRIRVPAPRFATSLVGLALQLRRQVLEPELVIAGVGLELAQLLERLLGEVALDGGVVRGDLSEPVLGLVPLHDPNGEALLRLRVHGRTRSC